jgi:hypothetical protein
MLHESFRQRERRRSLVMSPDTESRAGWRKGGTRMGNAIELAADEHGDLPVDLGDAASITRGQGGSGSDDKRYTYN